MAEFQCKRCGYQTNVKQALLRHLQKKKVCEAINANIIRDELILEIKSKVLNVVTYPCQWCNKMFNNKCNVYKHVKVCKQKPNESSNVIELQEQIKELQAEVKQLKENATTQNITQTANNIQNNTINITIKDFTRENLEYIDDRVKLECFRDQDLIRIIDEIHFHPDHPENNNVKIKNVKQNLMECMNDGKWVVKKKDDVLHQLIFNGYRILHTYYKSNKDDVEDELDDDEIDVSIKWLQQIYKEDPRVMKEIENDAFLLVLNNKAVLIKK